jgi:GntR family transcriptional regulator, rspAB operon transcriptional repressor
METLMPRPRKNLAAAETEPSEEDIFAASLAPDLFDANLSKSAQVYALIRHAIVQLALPPGAVINEKVICDRLGISRTPVREAVLQLASENLLSIVPNSGTRVAPIHLQDVFDGQLVRDALEMRVVRLAATRMSPEFQQRFDVNFAQQTALAATRDFDGFYNLDEEFHRLISECGASPKVWKLINGAKAQLDRVRRLVFPVNNHLDIVLDEHLSILDGLRRRDENVAAEAMQSHLNRVFETIRLLISEKREYFASNSAEVAIRHGVSAGLYRGRDGK